MACLAEPSPAEASLGEPSHGLPWGAELPAEASLDESSPDGPDLALPWGDSPGEP